MKTINKGRKKYKKKSYKKKSYRKKSYNKKTFRKKKYNKKTLRKKKYHKGKGLVSAEGNKVAPYYIFINPDGTLTTGINEQLLEKIKKKLAI